MLINCVYGKSTENMRKRINVKLINDSKEYLKCVSKPNFISQKIFDKHFLSVHQLKTVLTLNKPIYVGFCILELSKLLMYSMEPIGINEFIGLKSKMYSLISVDNKKANKAKGVNKELRCKNYLDVLFNKKVVTHSMKRIQSKLHEIGTYDIFKISLSCFDDKRYVLDDGIHTIACFHKDIVNLSKE